MERWVPRVALWFAIIGAACVVCVYLYGRSFLVGPLFPYWPEIIRDHWSAVVGLPGAAAVSFIIVVFLRQTEGPIEFEGLGFKFKGAAGQVAMWVICFLAFVVAIKLIW